MPDPHSQPLRADKPGDAPQPAAGKKSMWLWLLALLTIGVIGGIIFSRYHQAAAGEAPTAHRGRGGAGGPTVVSTVAAHAGDIGIYVNGLGSVTPLNTVSVNSRVEGQIMKVYYQEGQMVKSGDPLLDIDPGPAQAAVMQAEGQLERDRAQLEDAKLDLERYQEAFASNAIPKQQLDTQVAAVHQEEGTVKLDQGQLDNARLQLAYCHITAPIAGRVGLRLVDAGNIVQAGSTNLVIITQLQPISVIFTVAEDDLPKIQQQLRQGKQLSVTAFDRADQNKLAAGILETVDNQIDPNSGTIRFRAIFTNDDESLFPNQFVNAHLLVNTLQGVTLLPNTAIQRGADSAAFVYRIAPDETGTNHTVAMQSVTVGTTDGNISAVEGIDPGTLVVADNFNKLTDGTKVMVRPMATGTNSLNSLESTNGVSHGQPGEHKHKKKPAQ